MITKEEFSEWKSMEVTKAFFDACTERIMDAKDILASGAGIDSAYDNYLRGFIQAYKEIKEFRLEEESE